MARERSRLTLRAFASHWRALDASHASAKGVNCTSCGSEIACASASEIASASKIANASSIASAGEIASASSVASASKTRAALRVLV